jgi:hypothetical protein
MTLMIGLHLFFLKCLKNFGQHSVSGIVPPFSGKYQHLYKALLAQSLPLWGSITG